MTIAFSAFAVLSRAEEAAWTGAAGDGLWTTPGNWSGDTIPGPADTAVFPDAAAEVALPARTVSVTALPGGDGAILTVPASGVFSVGSADTFAGTVALAGGTLSAGDGSAVSNLVLASDSALDVPSGSATVVSLSGAGKLAKNGAGRAVLGFASAAARRGVTLVLNGGTTAPGTNYTFSALGLDRNCRHGGIRIAETVIYETVLPTNEMNAVELYLIDKWTPDTAPLRGLTFSGGTLEDAHYVKTGAGTASFSRVAPSVRSLLVQEGELRLTGLPRDLWAHFDADRAETLTTTPVGGTNLVTAWSDTRGNGRDAEPF